MIGQHTWGGFTPMGKSNNLNDKTIELQFNLNVISFTPIDNFTKASPI